MLMARFHTVIMLPTRSVLPCQSSTLHTRARACGSPAQGRRGGWLRSGWRSNSAGCSTGNHGHDAGAAIAVLHSRPAACTAHGLTRVPVVGPGAAVAQVAQDGAALSKAEVAILQKQWKQQGQEKGHVLRIELHLLCSGAR